MSGKFQWGFLYKIEEGDYDLVGVPFTAQEHHDPSFNPTGIIVTMIVHERRDLGAVGREPKRFYVHTDSQRVLEAHMYGGKIGGNEYHYKLTGLELLDEDRQGILDIIQDLL